MALKDAFNLTQIRALLWKDVLVRIRQPVSYFAKEFQRSGDIYLQFNVIIHCCPRRLHYGDLT